MVKPKENVEYTFIFPKGKVYTFIYRGLCANGRLSLENITTRSMTTMTPSYFSYLHRRNLRAEVPTKEYIEPKIEQVQINLKEEDTNEVVERKIIEELRSLGPIAKARVYMAIQKSPEKLADELEEIRLFDIRDQKTINSVFCDLFKARSVYISESKF